ncbi:MAG: hypothetical protein JWO59_1463 [Chloroflexi bacterium]|nr:hypothetical protein [Chloroflexota bacterium]
MAQDFLDEIIARRTAHNPDFPRMVDDAVERQRQEKATKPPKDFRVKHAKIAIRQRTLTARIRHREPA